MLNKIVFLIITLITTSQVHGLTVIRSMEQLCSDLKTFNKNELIENKKIKIADENFVTFFKTDFEDYCGKVRKIVDISHYKVYQNINDGRIIELVIDRENTIRFLNYETPLPQLHARQLMPKNGDVLLPTFVFRPLDIAFSEKRDAILGQSPYHFHSTSLLNSLYIIDDVLLRNYDIISSVVRGTFFGKEGFDWLDWKQARNDSDAIINEIVKQDWHSGNIIVQGASYDGFMALAAATTYHPAIKLVMAASAPTSPRRHSLANGGLYYSSLNYELRFKSKSFTNTNKIKSLISDDNSQGDRSIITRLNEHYAFFYTEFDDSQFSTFYENYVATMNNEIASSSIRNNDDLYSALKEVEVPIVIEFGHSQDQDSKDSLDLYKELKGRSNVKLVSHNWGHYSIGLSFGMWELAAGGYSDLGVDNYIQFYKSLDSYTHLHYSDYVNYIRTNKNSYEEYRNENYPRLVSLKFNDNVTKATDNFFGTFKLRFKVTGVTKPVFVRSTLSIDQNWIVQNMLSVKVDKDGIYEVETQHFDGAVKEQIYAYFTILNMNKDDSSVNNIKVEAIDVTNQGRPL
ncbi:CocE/NonD family hydrolase [Halobacteriovorax sp. ZH4_bin.1]|uniref:CocE/NonD family hydrolase n=1 Tax=unclassified Halobacteriovorax TaxID=2639665 RepID=UPI00371B4D9C